MGRVVEECSNFRAGPLPALKLALKEFVEEGEMEKILKELERRNGIARLPDGRRIRCMMHFDKTNFDNLCVRCFLED